MYIACDHTYLQGSIVGHVYAIICWNDVSAHNLLETCWNSLRVLERLQKAS